MTNKPNPLKTKTIGAMVYSDKTVGVFEMRNNLPRADVTFMSVDDIKALSQWLNEVSQFLEGQES